MFSAHVSILSFSQNAHHDRSVKLRREAARFHRYESTVLLCAGHTRLFAGALRGRTKTANRVKHGRSMAESFGESKELVQPQAGNAEG